MDDKLIPHSLAPTRTRLKHQNVKSLSTWTTKEDNYLLQLIPRLNDNEPINWDIIKTKLDEAQIGSCRKTTQQIMDRWKKVLNPALIKGAWSAEEDRQIIEWVNNNGAKNWSALANNLPGRLGKQCRERWVNSLDPNLSHNPWTQAEDNFLIKQHEILGNKWAQIAAQMPGRTDNSVKNRWNSSLKRKLERAAKGEELVLKRGRKPKRPSQPFESQTINNVLETEKSSSMVEIGVPVPPLLTKDDMLFPLSQNSISPGILLSSTLRTESPSLLMNSSLLSPSMLKSPTSGILPNLQSPGSHLSVPFNLDNVESIEPPNI